VISIDDGFIGNSGLVCLDNVFGPIDAVWIEILFRWGWFCVLRSVKLKPSRGELRDMIIIPSDDEEGAVLRVINILWVDVFGDGIGIHEPLIRLAAEALGALAVLSQPEVEAGWCG
jgi:hypothetical protein